MEWSPMTGPSMIMTYMSKEAFLPSRGKNHSINHVGAVSDLLFKKKKIHFMPYINVLYYVRNKNYFYK